MFPAPSALGRNRLDLYIDPKDHRSTTSRLLGEVLRYKEAMLTLANFPSFRNASIIPPPDGPHFVDSGIAALLPLELEVPSDRNPVLSTPDIPDRLEAKEILVNLSAGTEDRVWEDQKWIEVIRALESNEESGRSIGLIASPSDRSRAQSIATETGVKFLPTDSIVEVASLVAGSSLILTCDTSVVHLASAYNVPTLALYADRPANVARFAPLAEIHQTVLPEMTGGSIRQIGSAQVIDALWRLVDRITIR